MKGFRQRIVPVIGADPSTPKTMKRRNLKALGINTTSSKPAPSTIDGDIPADQESLHLEVEPSDEEEQEQRRSRWEKKRRSAGVFKHSYSQRFEEGSSYSDNDLYEVASNAHLTRRRSACQCDDHGSDEHATEKVDKKPLVQRRQSYVQHSAMSLCPPPLPRPPLVQPPQQPQEPLTSAIYVPDGASFGPGVGIPPLHNLREFSDSAYYDTNYVPNHENAPTNFAGSVLNRTTIPQKRSSIFYQTNSNGVSPYDALIQWPAERVQVWLANNGFSRDWQETFETLGLEGSRFLDIGRGHGSKGNVAMMHQVIFPQLYKQCIASGTGWDQNRERDEGRRLRRLVSRSEEKCGPRQTNTEAVSSCPVAFLENEPCPAVDAALEIDEVDALLKEWTTVF
jgi:hypothetical protein